MCHFWLGAFLLNVCKHFIGFIFIFVYLLFFIIVALIFAIYQVHGQQSAENVHMRSQKCSHFYVI